MRSRLFISGNEAVAMAAVRCGVHLATGYPGTPTTEIIDWLIDHPGPHRAFWHTNEKTALELGIGGAVHPGARALVVMKHVGLNVAADAFKSVAVTGITGGLVLVVGDDPGMHSSQNEFDSRVYAEDAGVCVIEPTNPRDCFDLLETAFELSEQTGGLVLFRMTTRVAHARGPVEPSESDPPAPRNVDPARPDPAQYVVTPNFARPNVRTLYETKIPERRALAEAHALNRIIEGPDRRIGLITCGVAHRHALELVHDLGLPMLHLGFPLPLPENKVRTFAESVGKVILFDDGYALQDRIDRAGIRLLNAHGSRRMGEWTLEDIRRT
ncbi:MAG: hypothetical protein AAF492_04245, partial [Verrucomicrobiota bacterium]